MAQQASTLPNGAAGAAILAAAIGSFALGLATTLSEASERVAGLLNFYSPVGPLSGKTLVTVVVWLIAWVALHGAWKERQVNFGGLWRVALTLVVLGLLGTFPLVFDLF